MSRPRGNTLLEQEKQRNWEKQREELANFQRLQSQHRQEQIQWEEERERQMIQTEIRENELRERELVCNKQEVQLSEERQELDRCREQYQQDLERLRDSMRTVEKEKEKLEQTQKKLKKNESVSNTGNFTLENEQIQVCDCRMYWSSTDSCVICVWYKGEPRNSGFLSRYLLITPN